MKTISFEIAKKMGKAPVGTAGYLLSSMKWQGEDASMVLKAGDLEAVKAMIEDLRGQEPGLHYRARGRSLEVYSECAPQEDPAAALQRLIRFGASLDFASDDTADVMAFASKTEDGRPDFQVTAFLLDQNSLSLKAQAFAEDDADPEDFYRQLVPILRTYGMGVMKN